MNQFNRLLLYIQRANGEKMSGAFGYQLAQALETYHVYGSAQFMIPYPLSKSLSDILNTAVTEFGYHIQIQFMTPTDTLSFSQGVYRITSPETVHV